MKRLLSTLFLFLSFVRIIADESHLVLAVWRSDGTKVIYALCERPKTTFSPDGIIITTGTVSVTYPTSQIQKYTYEERTGVIDGIMSVDGEITVRQYGSDYIFNNLRNGLIVQVFSVNGSLISTQKNEGKQITVSLGDHANGVYIIKVGDTSYKVIKR